MRFEKIENPAKGIAQRVVEWNAARFEQKWDFDINMKLLLEETEELFTGKNIIEQLDAVGDIIFVAIGVYWKIGFSVEQIHAMFYECDLRNCSSQEAVVQMMEVDGWFFEHEQLSNEPPSTKYAGFSLANHLVFVTCLSFLKGVGMQAAFYEIVHAICESNDTKAIKKTLHTEKANIDKGVTFVPPTQRLEEIYGNHKTAVNQTAA